MRTCPKVRGIAAHCVRLCPRNGEATAGLTELTINKNTREHKSTVSSFHIYVKFRKYSGLES